MVFQSRAAPAAQPSAEFNIDGEILQDEVIEDEIIQDEVLQDELVDNPAVPEKSEDFMEAELRKEIQQQEQRRQAMKDRIQYLWGLVRAKYKPKMTDNSFYAVYKQVMEARRRAYNEFAALGIPAPGEKKVVEEEEEEEVDEPKRRKRRVRGAVRISLVMRQGMRPFIRPTPIIEPDKWTETVRDITGEELAFLLMSWIQNVGLSLYKLADKICVVDKSHQDLIHELALLITTALMTRDHNDCIWPKYKDWRMELRPEGVCVSPHLYWHALRDYKTEMMDDIKDAELHRLLYCRKPMQRQMLFRNMHLFWVERLKNMANSGEPHPSNFAKYQTVEVLFDLENEDRFWKREEDEELSFFDQLKKESSILQERIRRLNADSVGRSYSDTAVQMINHPRGGPSFKSHLLPAPKYPFLDDNPMMALAIDTTSSGKDRSKDPLDFTRVDWIPSRGASPKKFSASQDPIFPPIHKIKRDFAQVPLTRSFSQNHDYGLTVRGPDLSNFPGGASPKSGTIFKPGTPVSRSMSAADESFRRQPDSPKSFFPGYRSITVKRRSMPDSTMMPKLPAPIRVRHRRSVDDLRLDLKLEQSNMTPTHLPKQSLTPNARSGGKPNYFQRPEELDSPLSEMGVVKYEHRFSRNGVRTRNNFQPSSLGVTQIGRNVSKPEAPTEGGIAVQRENSAASNLV